MARHPDASQKIDLEVSQPILVGDVTEVLRFVNAQVVNEDVRLRDLCDELSGSFFRAEIRLDPTNNPRQRGDGFVQLLTVASRDGDFDPFFRQQADDRQTDAGRTAGDDRFLTVQL
jgi:hypothetical protein